jgi:hypothetical protein
MLSRKGPNPGPDGSLQDRRGCLAVCISLLDRRLDAPPMFGRNQLGIGESQQSCHSAMCLTTTKIGIPNCLDETIGMVRTAPQQVSSS